MNYVFLFEIEIIENLSYKVLFNAIENESEHLDFHEKFERWCHISNK